MAGGGTLRTPGQFDPPPCAATRPPCGRTEPGFTDTRTAELVARRGHQGHGDASALACRCLACVTCADVGMPLEINASVIRTIRGQRRDVFTGVLPQAHSRAGLRCWGCGGGAGAAAEPVAGTRSGFFEKIIDGGWGTA